MYDTSTVVEHVYSRDGISQILTYPYGKINPVGEDNEQRGHIER